LKVACGLSFTTGCCLLILAAEKKKLAHQLEVVDL